MSKVPMSVLLTLVIGCMVLVNCGQGVSRHTERKIIISCTGDAVPAWFRGVHHLKTHVRQTMIRPGYCLPEDKNNRGMADAVRLWTVSEHDAVDLIDRGNQGLKNFEFCLFLFPSKL